jgi:hypothetical protein
MRSNWYHTGQPTALVASDLFHTQQSVEALLMCVGNQAIVACRYRNGILFLDQVYCVADC